MGDKFVARVYDAGTAEAWKQAVVVTGRSLRPASPIDGPIMVSIAFLMPRPKSLMRRKDPEGALPCINKPDADNLAKAVLDAMTQDGWWIDDSLVWDLRVTKHYHAKGDSPGASITVWTP